MIIMSEPDLIPTINTAAQSPHAVEQDGFKAVSNSIPDQIAADVYTKANANPRGLPFRRVKIRPGNNADINIRGSEL